MHIYSSHHRTSQLLYGLLFWALLLITAGLYWNGLYGSTYVLDDQINLQGLAGIGLPPENLTDSETLNQVGRFLSRGNAGSLGRPVSLVSFALQAHRWPAGIWEFKYVNLMLHLLNGALVFWFILLLTRLIGLSQLHSLTLSSITAAIWLLSPIQVSTVLYVIQRMTELVTLFTLLGLVSYLYGRQRLAQRKEISGYLWVSAAIALGGILATLSKENGVLLVLYVLSIEATVLHRLATPRWWGVWKFLFLYLPVVLLVAYFTLTFPKILDTYNIRDFSLAERLLTECRILFDYLSNIFLPRLNGLSLFHDNYIVSTGLTAPLTTLPAVIALLGATASAVVLRRRYPVAALAVLWFLGGHVLESSFVPLVLYFEHRNYLPMLGPVFALSYAVFRVVEYHSKPSLRKLTVLLLGLWLSLLAFLTWNEARLWANPFVQAALWAEQKPLSRYAQSNAGALFAAANQPGKALAYYRHMVKVFPEDAGSYALWLTAGCSHPEMDLPELDEVVQRFQNTRGDHGLTGLDIILKEHYAGGCQRLSAETIEMLLRTLFENPRLHKVFRPYLYSLYAEFLANRGNYPAALKVVDKSLEFQKDPELQMQRLVWLISANRIDEALSYIETLQREAHSSFGLQWYKQDFENMQKMLLELKRLGGVIVPPAGSPK